MAELALSFTIICLLFLLNKFGRETNIYIYRYTLQENKETSLQCSFYMLHKKGSQKRSKFEGDIQLSEADS